MTPRKQFRNKCPYCARDFYLSDVLFICQKNKCKDEKPRKATVDNLRPVSGRSHPPEPSNVSKKIENFENWVAEKLNISTKWKPLSRTAVRVWPDSTLQCRHCGVSMTTRACPNCHAELPGNMETAKPFIVSLLGIQNVGKSHYLTALIRSFLDGRAAEMGLTFRPVGDTEREFRDRYSARVYEQHEPLPRTPILKDPSKKQTPEHEDTARIPLIFEIEDKLLNLQVNLTIYDLAGGDARKLNGRKHDHIVNSDAIFLFIGPEWGGVDAKANIKEVEAKIDMKCLEVIDALSKARANLDRQIPVIVILTKGDIYNVAGVLPQRLAESVSKHMPEPDMFVLSEADRETRAFLKTLAPELPERIEKAFQTVKYFTVSSLGFQPQGAGLNRKPAPNRVEEPFIWLLHEMKFIRR